MIHIEQQDTPLRASLKGTKVNRQKTEVASNLKKSTFVPTPSSREEEKDMNTLEAVRDYIDT